MHKGEIETIEKNQDKGIGVTIFVGKKRGNAITSDFSKESLKQTVEAAYNIATFTSEDDAAGLPDTDMLERHPRDLGLYYRWPINTEEAVELAKRCEAAAFETDKRISNTEGASVNVSHSHFISANSDGFIGGYPYSSHSFSVAPIAGSGGNMQRDYWYTSSRNRLSSNLLKKSAVTRRARACRLNARSIGTRKCPVLFEGTAWPSDLLNSFVYGGFRVVPWYRKSSFLLDSMDKQVFPDHVGLLEDPHVIGASGSAPFDDEGVKTSRRQIVENGIVRGYFHFILILRASWV